MVSGFRIEAEEEVAGEAVLFASHDNEKWSKMVCAHLPCERRLVKCLPWLIFFVFVIFVHEFEVTFLAATDKPLGEAF